MVKFQFFGLFLAFFGLFSVDATPALASAGHGVIMEEQCNLPAPDSFRIIQTGGEFIQLAWKPIFPGATHQLTIMESDGAGGYVTILEENHVPGDTYIADDLLPGTGYRFVLATKCPSGDPSEVKTIIDGITLIVDLTVIGRKPANPILVGNCEYVPTNYDWIGFRVSTIENDQKLENYFELTFEEGAVSNSSLFKKINVNRHFIDHPIVAVNQDGQWPTCLVPIREDVPTIFRLDKLIGGGPNFEIIGYVEVSQNTFPSSLGFCPILGNINLPWNTKYILTPMVAKKASGPEDCLERGALGDGEMTPNTSNSAELMYEINDNFITVKSDAMLPETSKISVRLFNTSGQLVNDVLKYNNGIFSVPIGNLSAGFYILQISINDTIDFFKFVKSN